MGKFMRMIVFFDLPVGTAGERKAAAAFRKFLLKDGYYMVQFSVYVRICNGYDSVMTHRMRLKLAVPRNGSVRMMVITEKQYEATEVLTGKYHPKDGKEPLEQMTIF